MEGPHVAITKLGARQHGIVALAHALAAGLTLRQVELRVGSGEWTALHEGVYLVGGAPLTWKGRILAACWAGGFRAVASHRSAAALHDLAGARRDIAEITCPRWQRARHPRVEVHESKALDDRDITLVDGIPVTTVERALFDLSVVRSQLVVTMAFDKARRTGAVSFESVEATLERLARRGRPGVRRLRAVLASRDPSEMPPESEMETWMLDVIDRHGLPRPVPQFDVHVGDRFIARADAAYPEARIALEYQSYQEHAGPVPLVRDSNRRNRLRSVDWETIDVTNPALRAGGNTFCAAIRTALRRAA